MADYNEVKLEDKICDYLADHGWLYSPNDAGYDKARALFPDDLELWLEQTQPQEFAKIVKPATSVDQQVKAFDGLLDRLVKVLDTEGTLDMLRRGFSVSNARFDLAQAKPADMLNAKTLDRYAKNRLRVMRQVHYSSHNQKSIDLVLFINGLPVATIELKTDLTQSCSAAVEQYKKDRKPKDPHREPLLSFGNRALVHFAVSDYDVKMTTKLDGENTYFLPFNLGRDGGAGNPDNPQGSATSYLWERIWQRDTWLQIILKFMHHHVESETNQLTGEAKVKETLLFPRFHQWEVVTNLVETTRAEGAGHKYLVQHSAGSGKTNSIVWTAHQLSTLHDDAGNKVFNSVIVVTDRNILDSQLQDAMGKIDLAHGVVASIGDDTKSGKSKSAELVEALLGNSPIIVVTIQTFGFFYKALKDLDASLKKQGLAGRRFAVIADEAHSSQTGSTANKLKEALSPEEINDLEDGGEINVEDVLAFEMQQRAEASNISYYAFTATPKSKTLELFGTPSEDGVPRPFHLYTMKQAIEEGFILDVLLNFTPYDMAFQLSLKSRDAAGVETGETEEVDESSAQSELMRWVMLHPTNISQKVNIIVEHFRSHVENELGGRAKAMVVTDSRKAAVRYKLAMDKYIAEHGYTDVATLVAFSGEVNDEESGPDAFTEGNMNPKVKGGNLARAFAGPHYNIMLVANKFQTGFDQPLLTAMYVDKLLSGVTAVQTLSRLNRTAPGKERTYIIDFRNSAEDILEAFKPYYAEARLTATTDPNLIHDLQTKLDKSGIYTMQEVEQTATDWVANRGKPQAHDKILANLSPARTRFNMEYDAAVNARDKARTDELDLFRKDVDSFVRLYDFLSQIINYGHTDLEKRQIFFRLLSRLIQPQVRHEAVDLSNVILSGYQLDKGATAKIPIDGGGELKPMTAAGSGAARDPKMVKLAEVIARLNVLFDTGNLTGTDLGSGFETIARKIFDDPAVVLQIKNNSAEQVAASPLLRTALINAILSASAGFDDMTSQLLDDEKMRDEFLKLLVPFLFLIQNDSEAE